MVSRLSLHKSNGFDNKIMPGRQLIEYRMKGVDFQFFHYKNADK